MEINIDKWHEFEAEKLFEIGKKSADRFLRNKEYAMEVVY